MRLAAVEALANAEPATRQRYLSRMLADPVRTVRIEAARALAGPAESQLGESDRAAFTKALAEYVAAQTYNADRPEGRMSLGNLDAQRGDAAAAIAEYRKAIEIDPTFLAAYANLADLYRARGAEGEAVAVLREGLARNPRGAVLHHALGLSLVRQKQTAESLSRCKTAADLAPENARFAYVYAVALNGAGKTRRRSPCWRARASASPTIATCCPASRSSPRSPATARPRWATSRSCARSIRTIRNTRGWRSRSKALRAK